MKKILSIIISVIAIAFLISACETLKPWDELTNFSVPYDDYYSVSTAELVQTTNGISTVVPNVAKYSISFCDPDGASRGLLAVVLPNTGVSTFEGTYSASSKFSANSVLPESFLYENGNKVSISSGSVNIAENGLHSLTVTHNGSESLSFAKGTGVVQPSRVVNNDIAAKFLTGTLAVENGLNVLTLSVGNKSLSYNTEENPDVISGSGKYLTLRLVSSTDPLAVGTYKISKSTENGTFTAVQSYITNMVNNVVAGTTPITGGEINVTPVADKDGEYALSALIICEDGAVFSTSYSGIVIQNASGYNTYSIVPSAVYDATGSVVPGVMYYNTTITDQDGKIVAMLQPILAEGATSIAGTYAVAEYASRPGQMANGYCVDLSAWGMGIIKGGSYIIEGGKEYYIAAGNTITVEKGSNNTYTIKGSNVAVTDANSVPSTTNINIKADQLEVYSVLGSASGQTQTGAAPYTYTVKVLQAGMSYVVSGWSAVYTGTGNMLSIDFICNENALTPGVYAVTPAALATVGCAVAGYSTLEIYGFDMGIWGSAITPINNGVTGTVAAITGGEISVTKDGANYTISGIYTTTSGDVRFNYTGPLQ